MRDAPRASYADAATPIFFATYYRRFSLTRCAADAQRDMSFTFAATRRDYAAVRYAILLPPRCCAAIAALIARCHYAIDAMPRSGDDADASLALMLLMMAPCR